MPNTLTNRAERIPFGGVEDYAELVRQTARKNEEKIQAQIMHRRAMALSELDDIIGLYNNDLNSIPIHVMQGWSNSWGFDPPEDYLLPPDLDNIDWGGRRYDNAWRKEHGLGRYREGSYE